MILHIFLETIVKSRIPIIECFIEGHLSCPFRGVFFSYCFRTVYPVPKPVGLMNEHIKNEQTELVALTSLSSRTGRTGIRSRGAGVCCTSHFCTSFCLLPTLELQHDGVRWPAPGHATCCRSPATVSWTSR